MRGVRGHAQCGALRHDGTLTNLAVTPVGQIPHLIGCVTDSGGLAVFPSSDPQLCERLGLAGYVQPTRSDAIDLNQQLLDLFSTSGCMTMSDAQVRIEKILTDQDFDDWTATISTPATTERPCASFSLNANEHKILLVPIPRASSD